MSETTSFPEVAEVKRWLSTRADVAGVEGATESEWLEALARESGRRAGEVRAVLSAALAELEADGTLVARRKRWFGLAHSGLRRGMLRRTGRRAFRVRDLDRGGRYEVDGRDLGPAHHRDIVLFDLRRASSSRSRRDARRRSGSEQSARILHVIERASRRWVGIVHRSRYGVEFTPFDGRDRHEARDLDLQEVLSARDLRKADLDRGVWVEIQLVRRRQPRRRGDRRGSRHRVEPSSGLSARLVRVLGAPDDPNIETLVTLTAFEIPDEYPESVVGASDAPGHASGDAGRRDLRQLPTFTIDGASARDFDDAISIEKRPGGTRLWVHIADVSRYVRPGSALDDEARHRGTSVYFADRAVHMLPSSLSEGDCSLVPRKDRFALSVAMEFDPRGRRGHCEVFASRIRSDERLTYDQVAGFLEGGTDSACSAVGEELRLGKKLAQRLLELRAARGTFEIEQSQRRFVLDGDGSVVEIRATERNFAHRMIEEFMIQANVAVAELVEARLTTEGSEAGAVPMFRRHEPPTAAERTDLHQSLKGLGIEVPELTFDEVGDYAALLASVEDPRLRGLVEGLVLRSLQRAHYVAEPASHFALGLDSYCHFTSPIRRYPDLVMHRFIKAVVLGRAAHLPTLGRDGDGTAVAADLSELEQRAEKAEREQSRWRTVKWLEGRRDQRFPAVVTGIESFGVFVGLDGLGVDGLVPFDDNLDAVSGLRGGSREAAEQVRVRPRRGVTRVLRRGDPVEVEIANCDLIERRITLRLLSPPADEPEARSTDEGSAGNRKAQRARTARARTRKSGARRPKSRRR